MAKLGFKTQGNDKKKYCEIVLKHYELQLCFIFRNETSMVNLQLLRKDTNGNDRKVDQVVYGREYTLRADISHADGKMFF